MSKRKKRKACCERCIYVDYIPKPDYGKCSIKSGEIVNLKDKCGKFVDCISFANEIYRLMEENPYLGTLDAAEEISKRFGNLYSPKFILHLMRSSGGHEPVWSAWRKYCENREELFEKERIEKHNWEQRERRKYVLKKKLELGVISDPGAPPLLEEAEKAFESEEVKDLLDYMGVICNIEDQKKEVLKIYEKLDKKEIMSRYYLDSEDYELIEELKEEEMGYPELSYFSYFVKQVLQSN